MLAALKCLAHVFYFLLTFFDILVILLYDSFFITDFFVGNLELCFPVAYFTAELADSSLSFGLFFFLLSKLIACRFCSLLQLLNLGLDFLFFLIRIVYSLFTGSY